MTTPMPDRSVVPIGTPRPRTTPRLIRNPLMVALLWASKSDRRLLALCSHWAIATQCALGVFVCFTALLAFGSAYYTLTTLNASSYALWIALGYAVWIGVLDREIVGGLDKATAIVRPLLSLFIGTMIAIPVELWVFQERVDQELQRQYRVDNQQQFSDLQSAQAKLDQRRADLQGRLSDLRKQEADWGKVMDDELVGRPKTGRSGVRGAGPVFQNAQTQQAELRRSIQEVRGDLEQVDRSMPEEQRRLESAFRRQEVGKVTNFVTRYEAMDKVVHSSGPLYRLSWLITLTMIFIEMTPAVIKLLTPHVDYHHLVKAEIRENVARIDEISDCNYRLAMEHPERPELSVSEKFSIVRYEPVPAANVIEREVI